METRAFAIGSPVLRSITRPRKVTECAPGASWAGTPAGAACSAPMGGGAGVWACNPAIAKHTQNSHLQVSFTINFALPTYYRTAAPQQRLFVATDAGFARKPKTVNLVVLQWT